MLDTISRRLREEPLGELAREVKGAPMSQRRRPHGLLPPQPCYRCRRDAGGWTHACAFIKFLDEDAARGRAELSEKENELRIDSPF